MIFKPNYEVILTATLVMIFINFSYSFTVVHEKIVGGKRIQKTTVKNYIQSVGEFSPEEFKDEGYNELINGLRKQTKISEKINFARYSLLPMTPTTKQKYWTQIQTAVFDGFKALIEEHIKFKDAMPKNVDIHDFLTATHSVTEKHDAKINETLLNYMLTIAPSDELNIASMTNRTAQNISSYREELRKTAEIKYFALGAIVYYQKMFLLWAYEAITKMDSRKDNADLGMLKGLNDAISQRSPKLIKLYWDSYEATVKELKEFKSKPASDKLALYKSNSGLNDISEKWFEDILHYNPINGESITSYRMRTINTERVPLKPEQLNMMFPTYRLYNTFTFQPMSYGGLILKLIFACPYENLKVKMDEENKGKNAN